MKTTRLSLLCLAFLSASIFAGELESINEEIGKIGAEMITLLGNAREQTDKLDSQFASGKFDTKEMKELRGAIQARRLQMLGETSEATRKFRELPEIAAKLKSLADQPGESQTIFREIADTYANGALDTDEIKKLKDKIRESEAFVDGKKAELRKMFDSLPQFAKAKGEVSAIQDRLKELGAKRDALIKRRESLK